MAISWMPFGGTELGGNPKDRPTSGGPEPGLEQTTPEGQGQDERGGRTGRVPAAFEVGGAGGSSAGSHRQCPALLFPVKGQRGLEAAGQDRRVLGMVQV